ncbi:DNA polymerase III alpha subunit [hydrothermal vent metagenome]|uniref:DNA polymerase III alpha subunit n=1 Tax=hydrothermal vent metagenome TaxID=652676 RepID=A0A3B0X1T1_9ZZZZ
MNKSTTTKLAIGFSSILIISLIYGYSSNGTDTQTPDENNTDETFVENNIEYDGHKIETNNVHQPDEINDDIALKTNNKTNDETNNEIKYESKFEQRCLDILNSATQSINTENMTPAEQLRMSRIFNNCVYEIDKELALIEKTIIKTPDNMQCFNKVYEIRDYLMELGTDAQLFSDLPNNNDADRVAIFTSFMDVSNNILSNGEVAMAVRTDYCE